MRGDVGHVLLGLLQWRPRSGYEIKQLVDRSTRFFWAVSYGQIYPELRRLEKEGLVEAESDPVGARRRTRYRLTEAGRTELRAWLLEPRAGYELRDEGLLKLMLCDALEADEALAVLRTFLADREAVLERLYEIREQSAPILRERPFPSLALEYGIEQHEWIVEWLRGAERRLERREAVR
jgi:PadR family transcriptional regulator AphA